MMNFPILQKQREINGYTQESFAKKLGVSQAMVSLFESGQRKPTQEIAEKIFEVLKIPVEVTMGEPDIKAIFNRNIAKLNLRQLRLLNEVVKEMV